MCNPISSQFFVSSSSSIEEDDTKKYATQRKVNNVKQESRTKDRESEKQERENKRDRETKREKAKERKTQDKNDRTRNCKTNTHSSFAKAKQQHFCAPRARRASHARPHRTSCVSNSSAQIPAMSALLLAKLVWCNKKTRRHNLVRKSQASGPQDPAENACSTQPANAKLTAKSRPGGNPKHAEQKQKVAMV